MSRLSVNVNKIALLRNSRGANLPDVLRFALDAEQAGAQGITVHPRPDERHIRKSDVYALKEAVHTEFNIEGYPSPDFLKMVLEVKPHQCTLVPDAPGQLTSDHGWDTLLHADLLKRVCSSLKEAGIRVSLFADPLPQVLEGAAACGADRIEFYTGPYAHDYFTHREAAVAPFAQAAKLAEQLGLGVNAGHDLNLDNLQFFRSQLPNLLEVSIGHALVADCLYYGLGNVIPMYLKQLEMPATI